MKTQLQKRHELLQRDGNSQIDSLEVEPFIITKTCLVIFDNNQGPYGSDQCELFLAHNREGRWFVLKSTWYPSNGYSAEGTEEKFISFEEGLSLITRKGKLPEVMNRIAEMYESIFTMSC